MKRGSFAASFLTCLLLAGVTTTAYAAGIVAERSHHRIVVDGKEAQMEAYVINGSNYVRLRDIGKAVGFEVYWDGDAKCVQVESGKPYTGIAPVKAETSGPASQPEVTTPADDVDAMKQDIVDRTNALRRENGVAALRQRQAHAGGAGTSRRDGCAYRLFAHKTEWRKIQYRRGLSLHGRKYPSHRRLDNVQPNTCRTGRGRLERFDNPQQEHGQPKAI